MLLARLAELGGDGRRILLMRFQHYEQGLWPAFLAQLRALHGPRPPSDREKPPARMHVKASCRRGLQLLTDASAPDFHRGRAQPSRSQAGVHPWSRALQNSRLGHAHGMELLAEAATLLAQAEVPRDILLPRFVSQEVVCVALCDGRHVSLARLSLAGCRVGADC